MDAVSDKGALPAKPNPRVLIKRWIDAAVAGVGLRTAHASAITAGSSVCDWREYRGRCGTTVAEFGPAFPAQAQPYAAAPAIARTDVRATVERRHCMRHGCSGALAFPAAQVPGFGRMSEVRHVAGQGQRAPITLLRDPAGVSRARG